MKQRRYLKYPTFLASLFIIATLLGGALMTSAAGQSAKSTNDFTRVFVHFSEMPGEAEEALIRAFGGEVTHEYGIIPAFAAQVPAQALVGLSHHPLVELVEPDNAVYALEVYDAEYDAGWGIDHVGSGIAHTAGETGAGIKVGIVDSGVDVAHKDLQVVGGYNFWNFNTDYDDVYGHGTHVAGTACALDDGLGVVGVAPDCELYSLRVLSDQGGGYESDIIYAIEWALGDKITLRYRNRVYDRITGTRLDVINMSLGSQSASTAYQEATDRAFERGLVIAAAAGNDGNADGTGDSVDHPGRYDSVITVTAVDETNTRAPLGSNWYPSTGPAVDIAAPGFSVLSAWNDGGSRFDPQPFQIGADWYKFGSGTSMATPHVAGAAAVLIGAGIVDTNGINGIADEVHALIAESATPLGDANLYGAGLLNIERALEILSAPQPNLAPVAVAGPDQSVTVEAGGSISVTLDGRESYDPNGDVLTFSWADESGTVISNESVAITTPLGIGTYTFALTVSDAEFSSTETVIISVNEAAEVKCNPGLAKKGLCDMP